MFDYSKPEFKMLSSDQWTSSVTWYFNDALNVWAKFKYLMEGCGDVGGRTMKHKQVCDQTPEMCHLLCCKSLILQFCLYIDVSCSEIQLVTEYVYPAQMIYSEAVNCHMWPTTTTTMWPNLKHLKQLKWGRTEPNGLLTISRRLFETLQSLFWSIFGLISLYVTNVQAEHVFTEFVGATMFGTYNVISLVVLLNMLIAMMNNSYQHIAVSENTLSRLYLTS